MAQWLLFVVVVALLAAGVGLAWYVWRVTMRITPQEQAYDDRVAHLNERQANRLSDEQLSHPPSDEDAWDLMVRRGQRRQREPRQPRPARRPPPRRR